MRPLVLLLALTLANAACVPFVQHGPWVRQGTSGGGIVAGSVVSGDFLNNEGFSSDAGITMGVDVSARLGYVPIDSTQSAAALGLTLPAWTLLLTAETATLQGLAEFLALDGYVSPPWFKSRSLAVGVTASQNHTMPYMQFGTKPTAAHKWYTTQAVLLIPGSELVMWLPSFTLVDSDARRPRTTHYSFGGALGSSGGATVYMLSVGVTMEFFGANARVR